MGAALGGAVAEIEELVKQAKVVHMDESGWRERGVRAWIWVAVCAAVTMFKIAPSRGGEIARRLLGSGFAGLLITDRFSAYAQFQVEKRQVCWAHLVRDFQALVDRGGDGCAIGEVGLRLSRRLFLIWHAFKDGTIEREEMQRRMARVEVRMGELLQHGTEIHDPRTRRFCAQLLTIGPALFLFSRVDGVEPTNNKAERALRPAVLWRKGSFGTASPAGSLFAERMLTVTMTCRQQERPLLPYLRGVLIAADRGEATPSLLTLPSRAGPKRRRARIRSGHVLRKRRR
jgi:transposase